jgi:hypothetical protein
VRRLGQRHRKKKEKTLHHFWVDSEGGSARLRNLHGQAVERRQLREKEQEEKDQRARELQEKKEKAAQELQQLAEDFERCAGGCVCGQQPCKMQGYKKCGVCGDIKKRKCGKRECKAAQAPLLLTFQGTVEDAEADEEGGDAGAQEEEADAPEADAAQ